MKSSMKNGSNIEIIINHAIDDSEPSEVNIIHFSNERGISFSISNNTADQPSENEFLPRKVGSKGLDPLRKSIIHQSSERY